MSKFKKEEVCDNAIIHPLRFQRSVIDGLLNRKLQDRYELERITGQQKGQDISLFYRELVGTSGARWASSCVENEGAPLDSEPARVQEEPLPQPHSKRQRHEGPTPSSSRSAASTGISQNNVGWKLLQKAGWKVGHGLGAQEQGRQEPLQPEICQRNAGLGFERKKKPQRTAIDAGKEDTSKSKVKRKSRMEKRMAVNVEDPLAHEDIETKVKRIKQVMEAEADEKFEKAIARMVYSAFKTEDASTRAPAGQPRRSRRMTATNPLL